MLFKTLIFIAIACFLIHQAEAQLLYGYAGYPAYTGYYPSYTGYYSGLYTYPTYGYYGWGSNKGGAPETPVASGSLTNNLRQ